MNKLQYIIRNMYHIRTEIFRYLKPSEISNICAVYNVILSNYERNLYMSPINELFWSTEFLVDKRSKYDTNIALLGDDLNKITDSRYKHLNLHVYINKPYTEDKEIESMSLYERVASSIHSNVTISEITDLEYKCIDERIKYTIYINPLHDTMSTYDRTLRLVYNDLLNLSVDWRYNNYELCSNKCYICYFVLDTLDQRFRIGTLMLRADVTLLDDRTYKFLVISAVSPDITVLGAMVGTHLDSRTIYNV